MATTKHPSYHSEEDMSERGREFDISIDGVDDENGPSANATSDAHTSETFSAITIRALDRATLREWSATLDQVARELDDVPTSKHSLFTRANTIRVIKQLIARNQGIKIMLAPQSDQSKKSRALTITFFLAVQCDLLPTIHDELTITLESVAQTDTEMAFKRLVKRVEEQDAEIARLAGIISTYGDFTRAHEISSIVMHIGARYGPLSERMFNLAKRTSAAEVDGKPIIFRVLGCDAPIWLRSVIRFANVCLPIQTEFRTYEGSHSFTIPQEKTGGNEMSSSPISLNEWIAIRAHECTCRILIIMPVCCAYTKLASRANIFALSSVNTTSTTKPCPTPTVIFGNPFIEASDRAAYDQEITQHRAKFAPWLKQCAHVHVAQLGTSESQVASAGPVVGPIYQYNEEIAREYKSAIDTKGELDPTTNGWTYPTHIVSISGNVK
jgi:CRP-like cAMP-binding protein